SAVPTTRGTPVSLTFSGVISGAGGLTKTTVDTPDTLVLEGINTYTCSTIINNSTLVLRAAGSIANSALVQVGAGSVLDVSARNDAALTLGSGQSLAGYGTVWG